MANIDSIDGICHLDPSASHSGRSFLSVSRSVQAMLRASSGLHKMLWRGEMNLRPQASAVITSNGNARWHIGLNVGRR